MVPSGTLYVLHIYDPFRGRAHCFYFLCDDLLSASVDCTKLFGLKERFLLQPNNFYFYFNFADDRAMSRETCSNKPISHRAVISLTSKTERHLSVPNSLLASTIYTAASFLGFARDQDSLYSLAQQRRLINKPNTPQQTSPNPRTRILLTWFGPRNSCSFSPTTSRPSTKIQTLHRARNIIGDATSLFGQ